MMSNTAFVADTTSWSPEGCSNPVHDEPDGSRAWIQYHLAKTGNSNVEIRRS